MTIENNPQPVSAAPAATATARPAAKAAPKPAAKAATASKPKAKPAKVRPAAEGRYKVLTGIDDSAFCARVSDHLEHGWELYGPVAATFNGKNVILAQALLNKKKGKRKK